MREGIARWVARRLPDRVVRWVLVEGITWATTGPYSSQEVPALTAMEMLRRWDLAR